MPKSSPDGLPRFGSGIATTWADRPIDDGPRQVSIRGETTLRAGNDFDPSKPVFHVPHAIVKHLRKDAGKAGIGTIKQRLHKTATGNVWKSVEWSQPGGRALVFDNLRAFVATLLFESNQPLQVVQRLCRAEYVRPWPFRARNGNWWSRGESNP